MDQEDNTWIEYFTLRCSLCGGKGYSIGADTSYIRCECMLNAIRMKSLERNVPKEYWQYSVDDFTGNLQTMPNIKDVLRIRSLIHWYNKNIQECVENGYNLFLYGGGNSGKKMLAYMVIKEAIAAGYSVKVDSFSHFVTLCSKYNFPDFDDDMFREIYCESDILMLDKVSLEDSKNAMKGVSFINSIFESRHLKNKPIIVTSKDKHETIGDKFGSSFLSLISNYKPMKYKENMIKDTCEIGKYTKDEISKIVYPDITRTGIINAEKTIHICLGYASDVKESKIHQQATKVVNHIANKTMLENISDSNQETGVEGLFD